MAMIQCEECGNWISDRANACPHCGCPLTDYYDAGYEQEQGAMQARGEELAKQKARNKAIKKQNRLYCAIMCGVSFMVTYTIGLKVFSVDHLYSFGLFAICFIILLFLAGRSFIKGLVFHVLISNLWIYEFITMSACAGYLFGCLSAMRNWK